MEDELGSQAEAVPHDAGSEVPAPESEGESEPPSPQPKPPITRRLDIPDIFDHITGLPDHKGLREHFAGEGRVTERAALKLIEAATEAFKKEETLLKLRSPMTVVGDIHGQYFDLLKLTSDTVGGEPAKTQYLFLGDYVDRGYFSVECLLYLWSLKQHYPCSIHLLRGNHECRHLTSYFSFKRECEVKYSLAVYEAALASFNAMPLAAVLEEKFFCVHGGLSPELLTLADVARVQRFRDPPPYGPMCDLLWADPAPDYGASSGQNFTHNPVRGCSYHFTFNAVADFIARNSLIAVIRAHEAQQEGYRMHRKTDASAGAFPSLITIFSAPNYLDVYGNKGAVLKYDGTTFNIRQYNHSPHPYWLPNFADVFTWSLPFVADKVKSILQVSDMLMTVLAICSDDELKRDGDDAFEGGLTQERKRAIRSKIQAVSRMHRHYSTLRDESEAILVLKGLSPSGILPVGTLHDGAAGLRDAIRLLTTKGTEHPRLREVAGFEEAKALDSPNERRPPPLSRLPDSGLPPPRDVTGLTRAPLRALPFAPSETETVQEGEKGEEGEETENRKPEVMDTDA